MVKRRANVASQPAENEQLFELRFTAGFLATEEQATQLAAALANLTDDFTTRHLKPTDTLTPFHAAMTLYQVGPEMLLAWRLELESLRLQGAIEVEPDKTFAETVINPN